ncbi:hypothetical protein DFA_01790 [Cavenderia fasciculata]|uniref:G domain-containing protein n=1 Tax=Cavenderia fasciculata TaxID=261658 RepID=F4PUU2_CACFS|nr:uncharacterized protein DFA_01790 [Cavenderia fasciculata]EGG21904.1 hypothetical protein DFA_01790 [Cavenderia fasciculata]|eukprot:XP_004359755.1 hypothetical protein DFA_01790 [Cavenderia fasciculata]
MEPRLSNNVHQPRFKCSQCPMEAYCFCYDCELLQFCKEHDECSKEGTGHKVETNIPEILDILKDYTSSNDDQNKKAQRLQNKKAQILQDNDHKYIKLVYHNKEFQMSQQSEPFYINLYSFVGPTGVGKSALLASILKLNNYGCTSGVPLSKRNTNSCESMSSDINLYQTNFGAFLDCEGTHGTDTNHFTNDSDVPVPTPVKETHVNVFYPRLLHMISKIIIYVFHNAQEQDTFFKDLLEMPSQVISKAANNSYKPHLLLIFNKQLNISEVDYFKASAYTCDENEVNKEMEAKKEIIKSCFLSHHSIFVPNAGTHPFEFIQQLKLIIKYFNDIGGESDQAKCTTTIEIIRKMNQYGANVNDLFSVMEDKEDTVIYAQYKEKWDQLSTIYNAKHRERLIEAVEHAKKYLSPDTSIEELATTDYLILKSLKCQSKNDSDQQCKLVLSTHGTYHQHDDATQWQGEFEFIGGGSFNGIMLLGQYSKELKEKKKMEYANNANQSIGFPQS